MGRVYILPESKTEMYHDLMIDFDDTLESYLGYEFICVGDCNGSKVNWIVNHNKSEALFYTDTTDQNKRSSKFLVIELCYV